MTLLLSKTIAIGSIASLLLIASPADAKRKKSHRKRAVKAKVVPAPLAWYDQAIEVAPTAPPAEKAAEARRNPAPLRARTTRRSLVPSGDCTNGCDKSARKVSMTKIVLEKDSGPVISLYKKKPVVHKKKARKKTKARIARAQRATEKR